jgi:hypothetical protein
LRLCSESDRGIRLRLTGKLARSASLREAAGCRRRHHRFSAKLKIVAVLRKPPDRTVSLRFPSPETTREQTASRQLFT